MVAIGSAPTSATTPPLVHPFYSVPSWWNENVTAWPLDPNSDTIIAYLAADNVPNTLHFSMGDFAEPVYKATTKNPVYKFTSTQYPLPPELLAGVRIPATAVPAVSSDHEMAVWYPAKGYVWNTWHTVKTTINGVTTWTAGGGDLWYTASNGLDSQLPESNEPRNGGHRGFPQAAFGYARWDEATTTINHALKIAVDNTGAGALPGVANHVWPAVGDEGSNNAKAPEGTRLRLKAAVNVDALAIGPELKAILHAAQTYGLVVGDQSGGQMNLKVEKGQPWPFAASDLVGVISITDFEVLQLGYQGP